MIVLDASAAVLGLLNDGDSRLTLARETIAIPHLTDSELVSSLRAMTLRGDLAPAAAESAVDAWVRLGLQRLPVTGLLARMWALRENVSAYDATYIALAETLGCVLVTADGRLASAPGPTCAITVVRS